MNSSATLGNFPVHQMISVSPMTTIKESLLIMMKYQIRKIFLEDELCPFISERNVLGLVAKCASKNDYGTLDKSIMECEKNYAIALKEEKLKTPAKSSYFLTLPVLYMNKKYIFTSWDIATSFLVDRIHDYQKQLVSSEKLAMMGELSAKLNHELRNPLSVIQKFI